MMVSDLPFLIFDVMRCYVIVKFKSILLWCDHSSIDVIWCIILHTHHPTLTIHRPSIWYDEQWFMFDAFSHLLLLLTHLLHFALLCFALLFIFFSSFSHLIHLCDGKKKMTNNKRTMRPTILTIEMMLWWSRSLLRKKGKEKIKKEKIVNLRHFHDMIS